MHRLFLTTFAMFIALSLSTLVSGQSSLRTSSSSGGSSAAGGSPAELNVGDPAPGFDVAQWYPDEPQKIEAGVCYIVDFWSGTEPACKKSIPLLAGLQQIYRNRGLRVISITKDSDTSVQAMLQVNSDIDVQTIGVDKDEKTTRAWQGAAKKKAIPMAFVVDRSGRIVHIGSPLGEDFLSVVHMTVLDRWDPKLVARVSPFFAGARRQAKIKNFKEAYRLFDQGIQEDPRILSTYAVEKLTIMLTQEKNYEKGYEYARTLLKNYEADPYTLAEIGTLIATDPAIENRDFAVAMAHVDRAVEISKGQAPEYLSAKAEVLCARVTFRMPSPWKLKLGSLLFRLKSRITSASSRNIRRLPTTRQARRPTSPKRRHSRLQRLFNVPNRRRRTHC